MRKFVMSLMGAVLILLSVVHAAAADSTAGALPFSEQQTGPVINLLQDRLSWLGYHIGECELGASLFGQSTTKNVKSLQAKFFISPTGIVNQGT